jgi:hypothetical protein
MKYTSLIAAAAVLSASTYALDAKFGLGVEANNYVLGGERAIGTLPTIADVADAAVIGDTSALYNTLSASKEILGLKATVNAKMSDRFSLEAGVSVNSGKLELRTARSGAYAAGEGATDAVTAYREDISTEIKPTYGFGVKALFGFSDNFKVGPEVRVQRFETTHSGDIISVSLAAAADDPLNSDQLTATEDATKNAISTDQVDTTETSIGVAMSGMLNDKISVNAGYLTVDAEQHAVTLTSALDANTAALTGGTSGESTFNLESAKPTIDQYYVGLSMSF